MEIIYKSKKVMKQCSPEYINKGAYPKPVGIKLQATLNFIRNAKSLEDINNYKPFHFHQLKGKRKGEWSIRLNESFRLTLIPCRADGSAIVEGDVMAESKLIKVVMITEVSNHYE